MNKIIDDMHGSWVNFTKTGDPHPEWQRYTGWNSPVRIFDDDTRTEVLDRSDIMDIWNDIKPFK